MKEPIARREIGSNECLWDIMLKLTPMMFGIIIEMYQCLVIFTTVYTDAELV